MEVVRFGVGHRRPEGPAGTRGLSGQVIHTDGRGLVSELAFGRNARLEPHSNPNTTWFVVIEGGGWIAVADERSRVAAGEAVLWPADILHAAWTEHSEMRAIVVEFTGPDDAAARGILDGEALAVLDAGQLMPRTAGTPPGRGEGELAAHERRRGDTTREGEPY